MASRIVHIALDALETIGLADAPPSGIELMTKAGAKLTDSGRLLFPRALIEDTVANAARHFVLHGQDPKHDMEPWGSKVYFGTAGAAVHMVDAKTGAYRDSTTRDLYDIARVVDTLEHIHFYQRSVVCRRFCRPRNSTSTPPMPASAEPRSTSAQAGLTRLMSSRA